MQIKDYRQVMYGRMAGACGALSKPSTRPHIDIVPSQGESAIIFPGVYSFITGNAIEIILFIFL